MVIDLILPFPGAEERIRSLLTTNGTQVQTLFLLVNPRWPEVGPLDLIIAEAGKVLTGLMETLDRTQHGRVGVLIDPGITGPYAVRMELLLTLCHEQAIFEILETREGG
jgi:hypothetical protein